MTTWRPKRRHLPALRTRASGATGVFSLRAASSLHLMGLGLRASMGLCHLWESSGLRILTWTSICSIYSHALCGLQTSSEDLSPRRSHHENGPEWLDQRLTRAQGKKLQRRGKFASFRQICSIVVPWMLPPCNRIQLGSFFGKAVKQNWRRSPWPEALKHSQLTTGPRPLQGCKDIGTPTPTALVEQGTFNNLSTGSRDADARKLKAKGIVRFASWPTLATLCTRLQLAHQNVWRFSGLKGTTGSQSLKNSTL